jgi:hypothetical protein
MADAGGPSKSEEEALTKALISARMQFDQALVQIQAAGNPEGLALASRLRAALGDQNTGCNNSGCGGGASRELASAAR